MVNLDFVWTNDQTILIAENDPTLKTKYVVESVFEPTV